MPRASDVPSFEAESMPSPAATNALGVKGCGEAGCAGSLVAVNNAIADALWGVRHHQSGNAGLARARMAGHSGGAQQGSVGRPDIAAFAAPYLPLKRGGRFAQQTGWGSIFLAVMILCHREN